MKQVKCDSGIMGWQAKLREVYTDFDQFRCYSETFNLHGRLGFSTPMNAWQTNPTVQGSVIPADFRRAYKIEPAKLP